jgi:putative membrane protein insertion efficiency factor
MTRVIIKMYTFPIKLYQWFISPILGPSCRYTPSCSHYMLQAIDEWGILRGTWIGIKRIGRCHPWGDHGEDPIPRK